MAPKSKKYWAPEAKGHIAASHMLTKAAPNLGRSAPVLARKQASFQAAAKLAKMPKISVPSPSIAKTIKSPTPDAPTPTPNAKPLVAPNLKLPPVKGAQKPV